MKSLLIPALIMAVAGTAGADTLRLRAPHYYPYTGAADSDRPGFMVEVAKAILARHDMEVFYSTQPWDGLLDSISKGRFDCVLGIHPSEEPQLDYTQEPWVVMAPHIYVRKDDPLEYEDLTSFKSRRVAAIKDSRMAASLKPFAKRAPEQLVLFEESEGYPEMVRKLGLGEIDVVAAPRAQMASFLRTSGLSHLVRDAGALAEPVPLYVGCRRTSEDVDQWLTWLSDDILVLKQQGHWQALQEKYGLN